MKITSVTVGLPVASSSAAVAWYTKVFELQPGITPATGINELQIFPGTWLQFMDPSAREAPVNVLRVGVEDLPLELARLRLKGVDFGPATVYRLEGEGVITLTYADDPDGNRLCLYQIGESPQPSKQAGFPALA